jgi:hypothetical protein
MGKLTQDVVNFVFATGTKALLKRKPHSYLPC